jgi:hypothetical protein
MKIFKYKNLGTISLRVFMYYLIIRLSKKNGLIMLSDYNFNVTIISVNHMANKKSL